MTDIPYPEDVTRQHDDARRRDRKSRAEAAQDYAMCFATPEGQRVLRDLGRRFANQTFVAGHPVSSHERAAQREVVRFIRHMISIADGDSDDV